MARFLVGMIAGLCIGVASSSYAVTCVGKSADLSGWIVTAAGEEVCKNPYVDIEQREIACE